MSLKSSTNEFGKTDSSSVIKEGYNGIVFHGESFTEWGETNSFMSYVTEGDLKIVLIAASTRWLWTPYVRLSQQYHYNIIQYLSAVLKVCLGIFVSLSWLWAHKSWLDSCYRHVGSLSNW